MLGGRIKKRTFAGFSGKINGSLLIVISLFIF
jgi:hypothetical protein